MNKKTEKDITMNISTINKFVFMCPFCSSHSSKNINCFEFIS